jgi:hypothetical protein
MTSCTLESALRLLIPARNLHSHARSAIRALVRADLIALRLLRAGLPTVTYLEN